MKNLIILLILLPISLYAQKVDCKLTLKQHRITPETIFIDYTINFGGMVELRIYNNDNKLVYREQYIISKVDLKNGHSIKIKNGLLKPGKYNYQLDYKTKTVKNNLTIS